MESKRKPRPAYDPSERWAQRFLLNDNFDSALDRQYDEHLAIQGLDLPEKGDSLDDYWS